MSILIHGRSMHRIRTLFLSTVEWCALSRNGYFSFSKTKTNQNKTKLPIYFILIVKKRIPKFSLSLSSKIPIITQILLQFHHFFIRIGNQFLSLFDLKSESEKRSGEKRIHGSRVLGLGLHLCIRQERRR